MPSGGEATEPQQAQQAARPEAPRPGHPVHDSVGGGTPSPYRASQGPDCKPTDGNSAFKANKPETLHCDPDSHRSAKPVWWFPFSKHLRGSSRPPKAVLTRSLQRGRDGGPGGGKGWRKALGCGPCPETLRGLALPSTASAAGCRQSLAKCRRARGQPPGLSGSSTPWPLASPCLRP